jgi:hypothetical protein
VDNRGNVAKGELVDLLVRCPTVQNVFPISGLVIGAKSVFDDMMVVEGDNLECALPKSTLVLDVSSTGKKDAKEMLKEAKDKRGSDGGAGDKLWCLDESGRYNRVVSVFIF